MPGPVRTATLISLTKLLEGLRTVMSVKEKLEGGASLAKIF